MTQTNLVSAAETYLSTLCSFQPHRQTGSSGNLAATEYAANHFKKNGFAVEKAPFPCLDFEFGESHIHCNSHTTISVTPSPFSIGCRVTEDLAVVSNMNELESCQVKGKILLLKGEICAEQLMPKNFVFYNPGTHKKIISLLEEKAPAAIITATAKNPELAGALYPFPLIEDGDFHIPSVFCKDIEGEQLSSFAGKKITLNSHANPIGTTAYNVIGRKNCSSPQKIVVCAHIDTKPTTPGALDNASGVTVLLLLADLLEEYAGSQGIELIAFNGEDYWNVGGQMDYLAQYGQDMQSITLAINIDDAGYRESKTAVSFYECTKETVSAASEIFLNDETIVSGEPWYQGDHMIFVQNKVPAVAFVSEAFETILSDITHTDKDIPDIVDCSKLVSIATVIARLIDS